MLSWIPWKKTFPSSSWLDEASRTPPNTPDLWKIGQKSNILLFEYGEMMSSMPKRRMLDAYPNCTAFTNEKFSLVFKNQGKDSFPIALRDTNGTCLSRAKIKGELYSIPVQEILGIDFYRDNGVQYDRKKVKVLLPFLDKFGEPIVKTAMIYIGRSEFWKHKIEWDNSFYKGRSGASFTIPKTILDNRKEFNNHFHFTKDDLRISDNRCFIHLSNNEQQQQSSSK